MRAAAILLAVLLAGCQREPSFDERYSSAEKTIRGKADDIDVELAERERLASEAAGAVPDSVATVTPAR